MDYNEAMDYITRVGNFGSNYGLDRTYRLLELLGNPHKETKYIHVAGTNGKGSTTAIISKILLECGYKVGMYTSPFLEEFEERIQINNINISKDRLAMLMSRVKEAVDIVINEGYNHPTEFEIITVLMLLYFKEENVDYAVIEVGLGGRLDSTNVINPIISIITSISKDHEGILGNSLKEIATEKAGIIKRGIPTVIFPQKEEVLEVIKTKCKEMDSNLIEVKESDYKLLEIDKKNLYNILELNFNNKKIKFELALLGEHQVINAAVAVRAVEELDKMNECNIKEEALKSALKSVKWNGRFEVLNNNPFVVIDGAHNPQGIDMLCNNVRKYFDYENLYLILGVLKDKDVDEMLENICCMATEIITLTPNSPRALKSEQLKEKVILFNKNCTAGKDYKEAYELMLNKANPNDLILVCGSLYMIGEFRTGLTKKWN